MVETFTKHGTGPQAAEAEAAYLRWLREGSDAVVEVVEVDPAANTLTIERVATTRPTADAARAGGRELAKIHALGAAAFGAPPDGWEGPNYIGRAPQECTPTQRWAKFYVHQRVLPFAQQAQDTPRERRPCWLRGVAWVAGGLSGRAPAGLGFRR